MTRRFAPAVVAALLAGATFASAMEDRFWDYYTNREKFLDFSHPR
jgi:hypothetical protein